MGGWKWSSKPFKCFIDPDDPVFVPAGNIPKRIREYCIKTNQEVPKTEGEIAKVKSGKYGWSWDFIFIPKGETKTLGNFEDEKRWTFWNNNGYIKLAEYLEGKENEK